MRTTPAFIDYTCLVPCKPLRRAIDLYTYLSILTMNDVTSLIIVMMLDWIHTSIEVADSVAREVNCNFMQMSAIDTFTLFLLEISSLGGFT